MWEVFLSISDSSSPKITPKQALRARLGVIFDRPKSISMEKHMGGVSPQNHLK